MKVRYGDGGDCNFIPSTAISGVTPIVGRVIDMRDFDSVGLQLVTTGTVSGTWLIEGSNDFIARMNANAYGQVSGVADAASGTFSDITAMFITKADGTGITNPGGAPTNQYAQPRDFLRLRALRVTFTPAAGAGNAAALGNAGSFS